MANAIRQIRDELKKSGELFVEEVQKQATETVKTAVKSIAGLPETSNTQSEAEIKKMKELGVQKEAKAQSELPSIKGILKQQEAEQMFLKQQVEMRQNAMAKAEQEKQKQKPSYTPPPNPGARKPIGTPNAGGKIEKAKKSD